MSCYCDDTTKTKIYECVICDKPAELLMSEAARKWDCHKKITMICGMPEYICQQCRDGWYSMAGTGGGDSRINKKTGEVRKRIYKK